MRHHKLFNLALLAKQAWRLLQCPDSLTARILKSVYFPDDCILNAELGSHPSQIWRAIIDGRDLLKQGLIRRIGNGESANIWSDNWIPRKEMLRPYGSHQNNTPANVSELIDHTTAVWDMDRLQEICLPIDIPSILSIPMCTTNIQDTCEGNMP